MRDHETPPGLDRADAAEPRMMVPARKRILFVVTEDWYFRSHRLTLAQAAIAAGYEVHVACRAGAAAQDLSDAGMHVHPLPWSRTDGPLRTASALLSLHRLIRSLKPAIVHNVALKPVVLGSIVARIAFTAHVVNAVAGLGYAFTSAGFRARLVKSGLVKALRVGADRPGSVYLFQNPDDAEALGSAGAIRHAGRILIRGAGIDVNRFAPSPEPTDGPLTIVVVARMLVIKGIEEIIEASHLLTARGLKHRLLLVGDPDPDNPSSIRRETLERWARAPWIEWEGASDDVPAMLARGHVCVLASHGGEGLPKSLLEAAACGRAIVATDVPGNREIALHGTNALLVPPRSPAPLADAIEKLAKDADLRRRFAEAGRDLVVTSFSAETVCRETLALYERLLSGEPLPCE